MATTMEQRAKFRELRLAGTSREDAIKQAYGSVAPVTPTPTANPPVTPPVAPTQTMQGVNGETFQVAPTNAQGLSQPAQPTAPQGVAPIQPVAPNTPEPTTNVTPTIPVDQAKIERDKISAQNEATMAQNKQQAEIRQQERDKTQLDANNQLASDENAILNTLKTGGLIPEVVKTSPNYKNALATYNKIQQYSTYSTGELTTALNNGSLLAGTATYNEMLKDPVMKAKLIEAQAFTSGKPSIPQYEAVTQEIISSNPTTASFLADGLITQDEWDTATNSGEVVAKAKDVEAKTNKYNTLMAEYEAIEDEVKAQFPGSPFADSIIADRQKAKYKNVILAKGEMETANGTLIELKNKAGSLFEQNLKLYESRRAEELANQKEMRGYQMDIAKEDRAIQNSLALSQMQFDQKIAQQAQAMNDPTQAINSVISQYADQGIMATTSPQQHIAEFMKQNKEKGTTLGEYISQMQKDFQAKDSYKAKFAPKATATQDWAKLDDTTLYNQKTGELKKVSASEASAYGPSPQEVTPDAIKGLSSRLSGDNVQCGMVSNDYMAVKFPGAKRMGDSYESKVASVESIGVSDVPQVGGVFAMNTYNSNGHTGIVQSVDLANGTFTATDANNPPSQNGGPIKTSTYPISKNFTFSKGPAGVGTIRPSDIDYFNSATPTDKKKLQSNPQFIDFSNKKSVVMGDPNADIYEVMQYSQGGKDMGEERLKSLGKFSQGLSQVAELSKKIQETETGPIIGRIRSYNPYDSNAQALLAEINATVPNIARGVYGEVGVLTDADIQNYAKTLPNIKSTEDTNKLVLAMTLKTMLNGFKGQIQIDGSAGRDVSGFVGTVKQYEDRINQLLSQLGGNAGTSNSSNLKPDVYSGLESLYNSNDF